MEFSDDEIKLIMWERFRNTHRKLYWGSSLGTIAFCILMSFIGKHFWGAPGVWLGTIGFPGFFYFLYWWGKKGEAHVKAMIIEWKGKP